MNGCQKSQNSQNHANRRKKHILNIQCTQWVGHCCYKYLVISLNIQIRLHGFCFNVIATFTPFCLSFCSWIFFFNRVVAKIETKNSETVNVPKKINQFAADKIKWEFFFAITLDYTAADSVLCESEKSSQANLGKPICMPGWPTLPLFFPIHIQLAKHSIMQVGALVPPPPPMLLMIMMAEAAAVLGRHFFYSIISSSSSNFIASLHHQFFSGRNRFLFFSSSFFFFFSSCLFHLSSFYIFCHRRFLSPPPPTGSFTFTAMRNLAIANGK